MAVTTFPNIVVSYSSKPDTVTPKVINYQFGDGYSQRTGKGLHNIVENWSVFFDKLTAVKKATVIDFLKARGGTEAFNWTPPNETENQYYCDSWGYEEIAPDVFNVTATFKQVFGE